MVGASLRPFVDAGNTFIQDHETILSRGSVEEPQITPTSESARRVSGGTHNSHSEIVAISATSEQSVVAESIGDGNAEISEHIETNLEGY